VLKFISFMFVFVVFSLAFSLSVHGTGTDLNNALDQMARDCQNLGNQVNYNYSVLRGRVQNYTIFPDEHINLNRKYMDLIDQGCDSFERGCFLGRASYFVKMYDDAEGKEYVVYIKPKNLKQLRQQGVYFQKNREYSFCAREVSSEFFNKNLKYYRIDEPDFIILIN